MEKRRIVYLICIISCILLVAGGVFFSLKKEELAFHSVWTEEDKRELSEIWNSLDSFDSRIKGMESEESIVSFFVDWIRGEENFSEGKGIWRRNKKVKRFNQDMISFYNNLKGLVRETVKTGNAAYVGQNNWALLHLACSFHKKELTRHLIELGASVDLVASWPDTPFSIRGAKVTPLICLLDSMMADMSSTVPASLEIRLEMVEILVAAGADLNLHVLSDKVVFEISPFQLSCVMGYEKEEEILLKLIELGADITVPIKITNSVYHPLHFPMERNYFKVARKICEAGVDLNAPSILYVKNIVESLLESEKKENAVLFLNLVLDYGLDLNGRFHGEEDQLYAGETALTYLCLEKSRWRRVNSTLRKEALALLLEKGADANGTNEKGETPLMIICKNMGDETDDRIEMIRLLLNHKADAGAKDKEGKTAFDRLEKLGPELKEEILTALPELKQQV